MADVAQMPAKQIFCAIFADCTQVARTAQIAMKPVKQTLSAVCAGRPQRAQIP